MKMIKIVLIGFVACFCASFLQAQEIPTPPTPPDIKDMEISIHSDGDSKSSTTYSISISSDSDDLMNGENLSISISNSDDSYRLNAKYDEKHDKNIKSILEKELSSKNLKIKNDKYTWKSESNGDKVYDVKLKSGKLEMYLDKEIASESLIKKFEQLGQTIRHSLHGEDEKTDMNREAQRMQRKAERLQREADRMQREADRMMKEAKRNEKKLADQYVQDARLISTEAEKLADLASTYDLEASHKGAVSSVMRELLNQRKTYYDETTENGFNWTWPTTQNALLESLIDHDFILSIDDVSIIKDMSGLYVNGNKLAKIDVKRIESILRENSTKGISNFSFYKQNDHIVLINDELDLELFYEKLKEEGLIGKSDRNVTFQINGTSAYKNDKQLDSDKLSLINRLAQENNIIPAPGKVVAFEKNKIYKAGYVIDKKTMVGTWMKIN